MRIAHVSDTHLVEDELRDRTFLLRRRLSLLSTGRPIDPAHRRARLASALLASQRAGADHVVLTGDLTEDGVESQFETLARVLHESGIAPCRITLLPGNHDAYDREDAFDRALDGPLAAWARTSRPGSVVRVGDVDLLPVSTAFHQSPLRSAGRFAEDAWVSLQRTIRSLARDPSRTTLLALHHPPIVRLSPIDWVDGLRERHALRWLLRETPRLHVLHGHAHVATDRSLGKEETPRVFGAAAVVDSDSPLRVYESLRGRLAPIASNREPTLDRGALALHGFASCGAA